MRILATFLTIAIAAAPLHAQAAGYWVRDIGTVGDDTYAFSINEAGVVAGASHQIRGAFHAVRWDALTGLLDLSGFPGLDASHGRGVNRYGEVCGWREVPQGDAFLWLPNANHGLTSGVTILPNLGGNFTRTGVHGMNDLGQVVGDSKNAAGDLRAYLWLPSPAYNMNAGMHDLGTFGGGRADATAINNLGQVVGGAELRQFVGHPFLWLPAPAYGLPAGLNDLGVFGGTGGSGMDINDAGQIAGWSHRNVAGSRGFLWTAATGKQDLGVLARWTDSRAQAINTTGDIVGFCGRPATSGGHEFVATYHDGTNWIDLNGLIPRNSGWKLTHANDINAAGQITGSGKHNDFDRGFVLTPIQARMAASPTTVSGGQNLTLDLTGLAPGYPGVILAKAVNGNDISPRIVVWAAQASATGRVAITFMIPAGLPALRMTFCGVTVNATLTTLVSSNDVEVTVR